MTQVDLVVRDDAVSYEKQVVALHGIVSIFAFALIQSSIEIQVVEWMSRKRLN